MQFALFLSFFNLFISVILTNGIFLQKVAQIEKDFNPHNIITTGTESLLNPANLDLSQSIRTNCPVHSDLRCHYENLLPSDIELLPRENVSENILKFDLESKQKALSVAVIPKDLNRLFFNSMDELTDQDREKIDKEIAAKEVIRTEKLRICFKSQVAEAGGRVFAPGMSRDSPVFHSIAVVICKPGTLANRTLDNVVVYSCQNNEIVKPHDSCARLKYIPRIDDIGIPLCVATASCVFLYFAILCCVWRSRNFLGDFDS